MQLVIIADDLTGANDSAAYLRQCGFSARVMIYPFEQSLDYSGEVLVLDSESRDLPVEEARAAVASACDYIQSIAPTAIIYKKVDSTLRGHIGAELETLMDKLQLPRALFAPAFPQAGRTTVNGRQLLHGIPLELTELAHIPKSPVTTSDIAQILSQDTHIITTQLALNSKFPSHQLVERSLVSKQVLIADVKVADDLIKLAQEAVKLMPCVLVGSAGLAGALTHSSLLPLKAKQDIKTPSLAPVKRLLILSGSISAVSQEQCQLLIKETACKVFKLDPQGALTNPQAEALRLASCIQKTAATSDCVLVSGALSPTDVSTCRQVAQEMQLSFFTAGECFAKTMAALMKICAADFDGYVMTGGDTAVHACRAVQATTLELQGEIETGIAACTIAAGPLHGRILVSKAGAFGRAQTFLHIYRTLTMHQARK
ncbi:MAG: hypothetical protein IAA31_08755 [Candidatus Anaerobiospirillum merdipullorum]|uniref:Four-carbon acid sugar kinase family protein n=1 Tax=Candidatus Anaerobiospirillum merdipullorum TaxID=2838450 RepID=A0A9E2KQD0_9GAMM|nr:hypothetical protein [Candidatus Anaerobiospirillum merdipullorum]